jgi:(1->4)-alpha-D-glucan 1-alpha-D-glucosylmutase
MQFHAGFTFRDATQVVPYLAELGITHCYASPYLKARPGSNHGYDIVDHGALNPEIGEREDFDQFVAALHEHGLGQILDTVPNHMGVGTNDNPWWNDVLENGPASRYAACFDIAWRSSLRPELRDKVLLPVLADLYGDALEAGQITLAFEDGAFGVRYADRRFPVDPCSYGRILGHRLDELERSLGAEDPGLLELQSILTAVRNLPTRSDTDPERMAERQREKEVIKRRLGSLAEEKQPIHDFIATNVAAFNGSTDDPHSFDLLDGLLESQCYRLSYWRLGSEEINYRRFFDVNDLAALAMEREDVFEATHALVMQLAAEGKVDGLRIDHIDGLYDPAQYLRRLQQHFSIACARRAYEATAESQVVVWNDVKGALRDSIAAEEDASGQGRLDRPLYVVVEKILARGEPLAETWPVDGASGYEFLTQVGNLFVDCQNELALTRIYHSFTNDTEPFAEVAYRKKLLIMQVSLSSELHMLTHQLHRLAQQMRRSRDFTFNTLRDALRQVIASFPVYRTYIDGAGASAWDKRIIEAALRRARIRNPVISGRVFGFIRDALFGKLDDALSDVERAERQRFVGKLQQVTAPVMAKGVEDTAFYTYNRLISVNEVGGDPDQLGIRADQLHAFNQDRQAKWPFSLSPLSTHDTKRGEDLRARINVLSELPDDWQAAVERWRRMNNTHRRQVDDLEAPDANEEYFLYQTLVGAWPLDDGFQAEQDEFVNRIQAYMLKALREAKVHSSWVNPNPEYDEAVREFVRLILDDEASHSFLEDFRPFARRIAHHGFFNSLSQSLLKLASPGVPDTYQGTELWDLSLVDPDNRRPVDFSRRRDLLGSLQAAIAASSRDRCDLCRELLSARRDGRIKLYVHRQVLHCRRDHRGLLSAGEYVPLGSSGARAENVFAFARSSADKRALVAVPRLLVSLIRDPDQSPLGAAVWQDTRLWLPGEFSGLAWHNVFTGERLAPAQSKGQVCFDVSAMLAHFPVCLLVSE